MPIIMKKVLTILFAVALGLNLSAQDDCEPSPDFNQDGVVGMNDLLTLLSAPTSIDHGVVKVSFTAATISEVNALSKTRNYE